MPLKLACADFTFPLLSHDNVLKLIAMLDLQGVDIGLFEERSHLWPSREFEDVTQSARLLKRKLDDLGLQAADIYLQMAPDFQLYAVNHPEAARRAHARAWFAKALEYANEAGAKHVTALPGVHFTTEPLRASLDRTVEELSWRVEQAQQQGIVFGVEAHVGSIVPDPTSAEQLIKQVPGLTLTLDYTHFTRNGTPDAVIEPLVKYASHFHVRGARTGRLQDSFAHNTIDYRRVFAAMQASNYPGWLGIEYTWQDWEHCNECDNVAETILFRDFLQSLTG
ncbi:MAG: TIM barrel protein [Chloroflexi bacterium]|nr:TIM barrel protein [Chloroflexota bacterium]